MKISFQKKTIYLTTMVVSLILFSLYISICYSQKSQASYRSLFHQTTSGDYIFNDLKNDLSQIERDFQKLNVNPRDSQASLVQIYKNINHSKMLLTDLSSDSRGLYDSLLKNIEEYSTLKKDILNYQNIWGHSKVDIDKTVELNIFKMTNYWLSLDVDIKNENTLKQGFSPSALISEQKISDVEWTSLFDQFINLDGEYQVFIKNIEGVFSVEEKQAFLKTNQTLILTTKDVIYKMSDYLKGTIDQKQLRLDRMATDFYITQNTISRFIDLVQQHKNEVLEQSLHKTEFFNNRVGLTYFGVVSSIIFCIIFLGFIINRFVFKFSKKISDLSLGSQQSSEMTHELSRSFKNSVFQISEKNVQMKDQIGAAIKLVHQLNGEVQDHEESLNISEMEIQHNMSSDMSNVAVKNKVDYKQRIDEINRMIQSMDNKNQKIQEDIIVLDKKTKASCILSDQTEIIQDAISDLADLAGNKAEIPREDKVYLKKNRRGQVSQDGNVQEYFDLLFDRAAMRVEHKDES